MYNKIKRELRMFWNQILHDRSVAVFWLSNVQKNGHLNLEECTRQLTRMMGLMPSDFAEVNSTLSACAMIPNQQNFTTVRWAIQLLNHLLGLPNRASLLLFQERSSAVTFILKFFPHGIVNLLNISSVFTHFSQRFRRIQKWYRFHLHDARLLADDLNFELGLFTWRH